MPPLHFKFIVWYVDFIYQILLCSTPSSYIWDRNLKGKKFSFYYINIVVQNLFNDYSLLLSRLAHNYKMGKILKYFFHKVHLTVFKHDLMSQKNLKGGLHLVKLHLSMFSTEWCCGGLTHVTCNMSQFW